MKINPDSLQHVLQQITTYLIQLSLFITKRDINFVTAIQIFNINKLLCLQILFLIQFRKYLHTSVQYQYLIHEMLQIKDCVSHIYEYSSLHLNQLNVSICLNYKVYTQAIDQDHHYTGWLWKMIRPFICYFYNLL